MQCDSTHTYTSRTQGDNNCLFLEMTIKFLYFDFLNKSFFIAVLFTPGQTQKTLTLCYGGRGYP